MLGMAEHQLNCTSVQYSEGGAQAITTQIANCGNSVQSPNPLLLTLAFVQSSTTSCTNTASGTAKIKPTKPNNFPPNKIDIKTTTGLSVVVNFITAGKRIWFSICVL